MQIRLAQYLTMIGQGAFDSIREKRIELIHGQIREAVPTSPLESEIISRISEWGVRATTIRSKVRVHDPIAIPKDDSAPQPDIVWAKPKNYSDHFPQPDEVFLVIEVADSSLRYDCGEKSDLYAAGGIKDYWVVDVQAKLVHIFRQPQKNGFMQRTTAKLGEQIRPLAFPDVVLDLAELFAD